MRRFSSSGFRIVAFVHDEILIELPLATDYAHAAKLASDVTPSKIPATIPCLYDTSAQVMCSSMAEVCGSIPIVCKSVALAPPP